ncbi:unnamed protein product [Rotaria socialis]|uniref:Major facilitator superfamily (MFS) profile domain-containing protein n=1 Tax=Rotaria socialis TaxID=392032 RepID=A0A817ZLT8_9BILA|nr:unnamed protein product [Rotaria socialis]CAF4601770.1 unnamed protein product [Rotaria socialis]
MELASQLLNVVRDTTQNFMYKITGLFQRTTHDPQSDYAELVEDDGVNQRQRIKTIPATSASYGSYGYSRIPFVNSIRNMPIRYQTAFLSSLGFLISFGIRCNMGVSVVAMTHNETEKLSNGTIKLIKLAQFDWTPGIIGIVDSSFFWGYLVTQVPGGYLAAKFPANHVFGLALGISSFLNLFIPFAAKIHYGFVMILRILQGLVEGVTYPAAHGIWRWWAPPLERSTLATISFTGSYAGAVLGIPLSGILTEYFNWQVAFYFYGIIGIIWSVYWWHSSYERPAIHPKISESERIYIEESIGEASSIANKTWVKPPWRSFFTSMPVWAIVVANFCRSWSFYLLINSQAEYFREALDYNVGKDPFLAALPHLTMSCIVPFAGKLADYLRANYLSTTTVRKMMNCGGFGMEAVFLLLVAYAKNPRLAIGALTIAVGFSGFAISGFNVNHLDIAPRYASILMGISNGVGTLAGMLCPVAVEFLTKEGKRDEWAHVFLIASLIHFGGVIFYGMFASGEKQPWAEPTQTSTTNDDASTSTTNATNKRNDNDQFPSYGSTVTDITGGNYQSSDPFAGMANGVYANIPSRIIEPTTTTAMPLTIENPMYQNYR